MAEIAVLATIGTALASGTLKEVAKKAMDAAGGSSTVTGLKFAIFGDLEKDLRRIGKEISRLDCVLIERGNNDLVLILLEGVKEAAGFADNLLDEIAYDEIRRKGRSRVKKVFLRSNFFFRMRIAGKIKKFFALTADVYREAGITLTLVQLGKDSTSMNNPPAATIRANVSKIRKDPPTSNVVGRKTDEELIVKELCTPAKDLKLSVIAVLGRSGVGKTTLAKIVYDNVDVCKHFGKQKTWIFVSDRFELERFLDEILQSVFGKHGLNNSGAMEAKIEENLKGDEGYLLVLDDVWNTDEELWNSVKDSLLKICKFTRCRVLVTTQSYDVARIMGPSLTHELQDLNDADAWELFYQLAFANKPHGQSSNFESVGRRILSKCSGLPLAIKTMGSLLGSMDDISQWRSIERNEMWGLTLNQSKVMPWLLISFHNLYNEAIKQCFVHCCIIMEKGNFVLESEVTRAWVAQGFIQSTTECDTLEDICQTYVSNLVASGLLQQRIEYDIDMEQSSARYDPGVRYLWTHDLLYDLARFISKDTVRVLKEECDLNTVRRTEHLQLHSKGTSGCQYNLPKGKTLEMMRTLICKNATLSVDFAGQAKFLRDLRLISCGLKEVPSSIGGLKHLRYLSLFGNSFTHLPESITTLFNLQTLDLRGCGRLRELPKKINRLLSLRHILSGHVKIPQGVGQLTCLRTIPDISLVEGDKERFEMKDLKSLEFLSGELQIFGLEHISCKEEAAEASLKTKERIRYLSLRWLKLGSGTRQRHGDDDEIMEELQPHSYLEGIYVSHFYGKRLPRWFVSMDSLKSIILEFCEACEQLPALGQLGSLEELRLFKMDSLEVIGLDFYHNDEKRVIARLKHGTARKILFPRLKRLHLLDLPKLRDWVETSSSRYETFPCLEKLQLWDCPLLASAPACCQSLSKVYFTKMGSGEPVMKLLTNTSNLTELHIDGVEQLTSLFHPVFECSTSSECHGLGALRILKIENCPNLGIIHGLGSCISLETLSLTRNSMLYQIPDIRNLRLLTSLTLADFSQQMCLPEWLIELPKLIKLVIGDLNEEIEQIDVSNLPYTLQELTLKGWPKLDSLSDRLGYHPSLKKLHTEGCTILKPLPVPLWRLM